MQARAIFEAAASMQKQGVTVLPELMVPLVGTPQVYKNKHIVTLCKIVKKHFKEMMMMAGTGTPS